MKWVNSERKCIKGRKAMIAFLAAMSMLALSMSWSISPESALAYSAMSMDAGAVRVAGADANLVSAQQKYGISSEKVVSVSSVSDLQAALTQAGRASLANARYIVHVPSGTYNIAETMSVPENVLLVGEPDTTFSMSVKKDVMFRVSGSIFGGVFDSGYRNQTVLRLSDMRFSGGNGVIEKAVVTRSGRYGIVAAHKASRDSQIIGCTVEKSKESGVCVLDAAFVKLISNCNVSNNVTAGINLSHADVGTIKKCTIKNNGNKAVSTNSDPISGYKQPGCTISAITDCTMQNNKKNGVYIKPLCTLKRFTNNKLIGNNDGLSAIGSTPAGSSGKSIVKNVKNNTFKGSKNAQIKSLHKGALITIGDSNIITGGNTSGLEAREEGAIKVTGKNNLIQGNKGAGINAGAKGKLSITGSGNVIRGNKRFAVYCKEKSTITLKKVKISGRIYIASGGKVVRR